MSEYDSFQLGASIIIMAFVVAIFLGSHWGD